MKRTKDQRLAERLGIKLTRREGPFPPGCGSTWAETWYSYQFQFTALVLVRGSTKKTRPGAQFYGTGFGALSNSEAWTRALEQFSRAIRPSERP